MDKVLIMMQTKIGNEKSISKLNRYKLGQLNTTRDILYFLIKSEVKFKRLKQIKFKMTIISAKNLQ